MNINVKNNVSLKEYTSLGIGGITKRLFLPKTKEEVEYILNHYQPIILGEGTNVLINDTKVYDDFMVLKYFKDIKREGNKIIASAGMRLIDVCLYAYQEGLSGLEFAYGIPGSVGGAIMMNAGAYGGEIKHITSSVMTNVKEYLNDECAFSYRHSIFSDNRECILYATFNLVPKDKASIASKMIELMEKRVLRQPLDKRSAGSTFKRGKDFYASKIIDECGLRGYGKSDAKVSHKHTGFLINDGNASYQDYIDLINEVKEIVYQKKGRMLECEIKIIN